MQEGILLVLHRIDFVDGSELDSDFSVLVHFDIGSKRLAIADETELHCLTAVLGKSASETGERLCFDSIDRCNTVASLEPCVGGTLAVNGLVDYHRHRKCHHLSACLFYLAIHLENKVAREVDCYGVGAAAQHCNLFRTDDVEHIGFVGDSRTIGCKRNVTIDKTGFLCSLAILHSESGIGEIDVCFALCVGKSGIDDNSEDEIKQHACNHHQKALPCRLGTKFPTFGRLLELFGIHRLIYHSGNLDISAEREPADAVGCVAPCGAVAVGIRVLTIVFAFWLVGVGCEPRVEEQTEFLNLNAKKACKNVVTKLVDDYKNGKCEY